MPVLTINILQPLLDLDRDMFLAINNWHNSYWDVFMMLCSDRRIWLPFYLSFIYMMFRNFPLRVNIICLSVIVILITISDQVTSTFIRPWIGRLRPANLHNPISSFVHIVDGYRGGNFSCPSAHAANCWSFTFFIIYLFRRHILSAFMIFWALVICYSRLYLGVHYPFDLLFGMLIGFVAASGIYYIFQRLRGEDTHIYKPAGKNLKHEYVPLYAGIITFITMLVWAI